MLSYYLLKFMYYELLSYVNACVNCIINREYEMKNYNSQDFEHQRLL